MNELLGLAVSAHGGLERWRRIRSIDVSLIISGQLLEVKGFPEHQHTKVTIDADRPRTVMEPYGEEGARGIYTPGRVWIESRDDGREIVELKEPRASFAGHVRDTKWDQLQRLYFLGYAIWNYLATPLFSFGTASTSKRSLATTKTASSGEFYRCAIRKTYRRTAIRSNSTSTATDY